MNLLDLAKEVQKEKALHDVGGDEATLASVPGAVRVRSPSSTSRSQQAMKYLTAVFPRGRTNSLTT
jgi:hypothetical protein